MRASNLLTSTTAAATPGKVVLGIFRAMRPGDYLKNTLVFAALVFSGHLAHRSDILFSLLAFAALCFAASAVYLWNDAWDREADRLHPSKQHRAVASGLVPVWMAVSVGVCLALCGVAVGFAVNLNTGLAVLGYLALTTAYTLRLKHVVIVDVLTLASGFVLRVITGAEAIQVEFSSWLMLCTFLLALFLGFGKRRHELTLMEEDAGRHRAILSEYSPYYLDMMSGIVTAGTMMSYVLYTMDPLTLVRFGGRRPIYTSVFVLYGIFRYLYLIHRKQEGGDTVRTIYQDRGIKLAVLLWIVSIILLRYL
ncbi:MAG: decaprenyl-phosphate phosphoribosyltransferase [Acidobacteria bacterium]|nr:decaprenyl-phosphate phosphoribosyltransferase [Acidobacteriota bacterium]